MLCIPAALADSADARALLAGPAKNVLEHALIHLDNLCSSPDGDTNAAALSISLAARVFGAGEARVLKAFEQAGGLSKVVVAYENLAPSSSGCRKAVVILARSYFSWLSRFTASELAWSAGAGASSLSWQRLRLLQTVINSFYKHAEHADIATRLMICCADAHGAGHPFFASFYGDLTTASAVFAADAARAAFGAGDPALVAQALCLVARLMSATAAPVPAADLPRRYGVGPEETAALMRMMDTARLVRPEAMEKAIGAAASAVAAFPLDAAVLIGACAAALVMERELPSPRGRELWKRALTIHGDSLAAFKGFLQRVFAQIGVAAVAAAEASFTSALGRMVLGANLEDVANLYAGAFLRTLEAEQQAKAAVREARPWTAAMARDCRKIEQAELSAEDAEVLFSILGENADVRCPPQQRPPVRHLLD